MYEPIDKKFPFRSSQLEDGDMVCFQKFVLAESRQRLRYPDVPSFLEYMHNRQFDMKRAPSGTMTVEGCGTSSLQGDVKFVEVLEKMGAEVTWTETSVTVKGPSQGSSGLKRLRAVDVNMNKMPDVAMTLDVVVLYDDGPTSIRDVASWRVKETERMIAICTELRKLGATVEGGTDYCIITLPEKLNLTSIDTYDDHRMVMTFSLAACSDVPVTIKDPGCTRKTFPNYFDVIGTYSMQ